MWPQIINYTLHIHYKNIHSTEGTYYMYMCTYVHVQYLRRYSHLVRSITSR